jgi:hypothetical protein
VLTLKLVTANRCIDSVLRWQTMKFAPVSWVVSSKSEPATRRGARVCGTRSIPGWAVHSAKHNYMRLA